MNTPTSYGYSAEVVRLQDGVGFGRREVPPSYLEPAREETFFSAQRRGLLGPDPNGIEVVEAPAFIDEGSGQISGLSMTVGLQQRGEDLTFGLGLFEGFASRITGDLLKAKELRPDDRAGYRVFARPEPPTRPDDPVVARVVREPLAWSEGRLAPWLDAGRPEGPVDERHYPLFILDSALQQARALSWKGRQSEGGCWLVGNLFRQLEPEPEIFGVVHTVLEADGLEHDRFGLKLSTDTFVRLEARMARRRQRLGRRNELALGFYHSHPFLPSELYGHDACTGCEKRPECSLSSAFLSQHDARFHMAMFGRAAYAVELVLGLSPREEFQLGAFCVGGGQFHRRGFHRVADPPAGTLDNPNQG